MLISKFWFEVLKHLYLQAKLPFGFNVKGCKQANSLMITPLAILVSRYAQPNDENGS